MSNKTKKTQTNKAVEKNAEVESRKSGKAIIFAAVAVVIIAAVLVGIFVIKPAVQKIEEPTTVPIVTNPPAEGEIRVLQLMPKWEPGMQKGEAVRVRYTIPITYRLR